MQSTAVRPGGVEDTQGPGYKWIALSNTTLGVLIATINLSIILIALPDIFRGIGVDPLQPGNTSLLLWLIMSYMVVTAVLVVSFGRLGDMYGRVRMYNLGFAVFTAFSVLLSVTWMHGTAGALWLIGMRVLQGVGGAMLMANSNAILTDAFPPRQRGLALGLNQVAAIAGSFMGLVLGGLLGPFNWHLVFLVSVPIGLFGTVWAYLKLYDTGGLFASPNRAAIMNSLPPDQRGVGAGISTTFQNSATVLSIGIFFSLMIAGLASSLPDTLAHGLTEQGVPSADAARVAALPPVGVLFAALLGYNPVRSLLGPETLAQLPASHADYLTGRAFFPTLISEPFEQGLSVAFDFAIVACLVAAVVSLLRGGRYVNGETATAKA
ncbi:MFS transporter [Streptomyces laculatispora]|uniref:MFS transporter n=1 Tax=Streptomyces laculatispora TaxID=887464 RepID=UPI001A943E37|nr:MFS transporter [Streptomyces laculatispora]MBO0912893.1 MFS transporter [Streptomyces laculatispora]